MEGHIIDLFEKLVAGMSLPGDKICATFHKTFHDLTAETIERALKIIQDHYPEIMSQIHGKLQQA